MASCMLGLSNALKCTTRLSMGIHSTFKRSFSVLRSIPFNFLPAVLNRKCYLEIHPAAQLHTSSPKFDLMEFFDKKENLGEESVKVGRPWKLDELRLKSNEDLHKLWYILLKERNMLMTMAEEYKRQCELFPSPERLEKVEESMENLLDVVAERDNAYSLLETGERSEPGRRWAYNELGMGYWHKCSEHYVPLSMNNRLRRRTALAGPWQHKYLRLMREKRLWDRSRKLRRLHAIHRAYSERFPEAELNVDLSKFQNTLSKSMRGPDDLSASIKA